MKKIKFLSIAALVMTLGTLSACGNDNGNESSDGNNKSEHQHTYAESWSNDENQHWHAATCEHTNEKSGLGNHVFGDDNIYNTCGYEKEVITPVFKFLLII